MSGRINPIGEAARLLVGKDVKISVDEPWRFEGPDGTNVLKGRITAVGQDILDDPGSQWVEIDVETPFAGKGDSTVDHLKARGRYELPAGIVEQVAFGETAIVHLGYEDQVGEEDLPEGSSPYLIGGLHLAGDGTRRRR